MQLTKLANAAARGDTKAYSSLCSVAESGDPKALRFLGQLNDCAGYTGITPDPAAARCYYARAVQLGDAQAAFALAHMLDCGEGGERDDAGARRLYGIAAEAGVRDAQVHYARFLETGRGGEKNIDGAVRWYRLAIHQGDEIAATNLALMHLGRQVAEPDALLAQRLLLFAANRLDGHAHFMLGVVYMLDMSADQWRYSHALFHLTVAVMILTDAGIRQQAEERREQLLRVYPPAKEPAERDARKFVEERRPAAARMQ
jgi:TPR repeat protein